MTDSDKLRGLEGRALSGRVVTGRELGLRSVSNGSHQTTTPLPAPTTVPTYHIYGF